MTVKVSVEMEAQTAVDLHSLVTGVREVEAKKYGRDGLDERYRDVLMSLERALRGIGYVPSDGGWQKVPPSRRS